MDTWSTNLVYNFSKAMRLRRKALSWSVQDLVDKTEELGNKISRSTLSGLENNRNKNRLNLPDAIVICEALELPLRALLCEDGRAMKILDADPIASKDMLANSLLDALMDNQPSTRKALS